MRRSIGPTLTGVGLLLSGVVLARGVIGGFQFLPAVDDSDGFAMQVWHVGSLLASGDLLASLTENWLLLVHVVRLVAVAPFLGAEAVFGAVAPLLMLLVLLWPLTRVPGSGTRSALGMVPLLLPLVVSGRSVLVAVGTGYVIMYLLERRHSWMLWLGSLFVNLSSASVVMAVLVLLAGRLRQDKHSRQLGWQRVVVCGLLILSLGVSVADKLVGFGAGSPGYESHAFDSESIVLTILSRSTLLVSLVDGQYMRAIAYALIALLLAAKLLAALLNPQQRVARRIVLCCAPGILLEGLGVIAMVFPLVWLLQGFAADRRRRPVPVSLSA